MADPRAPIFHRDEDLIRFLSQFRRPEFFGTTPVFNQFRSNLLPTIPGPPAEIPGPPAGFVESGAEWSPALLGTGLGLAAAAPVTYGIGEAMLQNKGKQFIRENLLAALAKKYPLVANDAAGKPAFIPAEKTARLLGTGIFDIPGYFDTDDFKDNYWVNDEQLEQPFANEMRVRRNRAGFWDMFTPEGRLNRQATQYRDAVDFIMAMNEAKPSIEKATKDLMPDWEARQKAFIESPFDPNVPPPGKKPKQRTAPELPTEVGDAAKLTNYGRNRMAGLAAEAVDPSALSGFGLGNARNPLIKRPSPWAVGFGLLSGAAGLGGKFALEPLLAKRKIDELAKIEQAKPNVPKSDGKIKLDQQIMSIANSLQLIRNGNWISLDEPAAPQRYSQLKARLSALADAGKLDRPAARKYMNSIMQRVSQ